MVTCLVADAVVAFVPATWRSIPMLPSPSRQTTWRRLWKRLGQGAGLLLRLLLHFQHGQRRAADYPPRFDVQFAIVLLLPTCNGLDQPKFRSRLGAFVCADASVNSCAFAEMGSLFCWSLGLPCR